MCSLTCIRCRKNGYFLKLRFQIKHEVIGMFFVIRRDNTNILTGREFMLFLGAHSDKIFLFGILLLLEFPIMAQDSNFRFSMPEIERILKSGDWQLSKVSTISRLGSEASYQAKRATLELSEGKTLRIKWKTAPRAGEDFNNQPRYEIAAYELQKLFLTPEYYVVPPTLGLTLPVQQYRQIDRDVLPTFDDTK